MSHHHDHSGQGHHHHHEGEEAPALSLAEKLEKLLDHWIRHNADHAETYRAWAGRARAEGMEEIAGLLDQAAGDNAVTNGRMEKALKLVRMKDEG